MWASGAGSQVFWPPLCPDVLVAPSKEAEEWHSYEHSAKAEHLLCTVLHTENSKSYKI